MMGKVKRVPFGIQECLAGAKEEQTEGSETEKKRIL